MARPCIMVARASTKTFVSRIHIRQPSPKNSEKKSSLPEKFVSRVTRQPRYHCIDISAFTAVYMRHSLFWDFAQRRLAPRYRRFGQPIFPESLVTPSISCIRPQKSAGLKYLTVFQKSKNIILSLYFTETDGTYCSKL